MSWSLEFDSSAPAGRLFKAMILDWHNVAPKVVPEIVASASLEGDGVVGSVKTIKFTPVVPYGFLKNKLDFVDHANFEAKQSIVGGGEFGTKIETETWHYKFMPASNGGCVVKVVATYKLLPGVKQTSEEKKAEAKEALTGMIKATEAYLQANPNAYA